MIEARAAVQQARFLNCRSHLDVAPHAPHYYNMPTNRFWLCADPLSIKSVVEATLVSFKLDITWIDEWTLEAETGSRKMNFFFADGAPYTKIGVHLSTVDRSILVQVDHISHGIGTVFGSWKSRRLVTSINNTLKENFEAKKWLVTQDVERP